MHRNIFFLLLFILINIQPTYAQTQSVQIKTNLAFFSEKFLGVENNFRYSGKGITKLDLKYDSKNSLSKLSLNYSGDGKYTLDGSYLQHSFSHHLQRILHFLQKFLLHL